jgi:hypothetical protein
VITCVVDPSLAAYETYRSRFGVDPEFVAADKIRDDSGCVLRYERTFMRPLLSAQLPSRRRCYCMNGAFTPYVLTRVIPE